MMTQTSLLQTHTKVAVAMSSEIFDYSPHLLKMQALIKELHTSTLHKDWDTSRELSLQIATEARLLLNWLRDQK